MALNDVFKQIDQLQEKINSFGKLSNDTLKKIQYKFRLDWNYHSNAMEGNSLTQQETRSVMVNILSIEDKPIKDVMEVRGHDAIISDILKIGKGELKLSEKRIKEIHKAIIYEDNPELQKKLGVWKTENNHVINYKDEKYEFTTWPDVPEAMHDLLNEANARIDEIVAKKKDALHPVFLAIHFHLAFVSIHPFYDGNGRTARILMNLILISLGYPPIIIKVNDKNIYNQYLADIQGYGGNPDLFLEFMGKLLIKSQQLILTVIEGGDIEEPDDLDKKLLLLEKELSGVDPDHEVKERFSGSVFIKIYDGWISELLKTCIPVIQKFNKFFSGTRHYISIGHSSVAFVNEPAEEIIEKLKIEFARNIGNFNSHDAVLRFATHYGTLIKGGLNTFGCNYGFEIKFDDIKYSIWADEFTETAQRKQKEFFKERLLHQPLTIKEIETLTKYLGEVIYHHIDFNTKKNGIR